MLRWIIPRENQWHILKLVRGRRFPDLKMRFSRKVLNVLGTCLYLDIFYLFGSYFAVCFKSIFSYFGAPSSDFRVSEPAVHARFKNKSFSCYMGPFYKQRWCICNQKTFIEDKHTKFISIILQIQR